MAIVLKPRLAVDERPRRCSRSDGRTLRQATPASGSTDAHTPLKYPKMPVDPIGVIREAMPASGSTASATPIHNMPHRLCITEPCWNVCEVLLCP